MRRPLLLALALGVTTLAAACGTSGRDLRVPAEGAVSPTRSTVSTAPSTSGSAILPANTFSLTSPDFASGGPIPGELTCTGPSPALVWSGIPAGTKELALVVVDPSANDFVHWVVTGIAPTPGTVARGAVPTGAVQQANTSGRIGWTGPCPAAGAAHTYNFMLFALPSTVSLAGKSPKESLTALQDAAQGNLTILSGTVQVGGGTTPGSGAKGTAAPGSAVKGTTAR